MLEVEQQGEDRNQPDKHGGGPVCPEQPIGPVTPDEAEPVHHKRCALGAWTPACLRRIARRLR